MCTWRLVVSSSRIGRVWSLPTVPKVVTVQVLFGLRTTRRISGELLVPPQPLSPNEVLTAAKIAPLGSAWSDFRLMWSSAAQVAE